MTILTFQQLRDANISRQTKVHPDGMVDWSRSDWITALVGEIGEAANIIKKLNRLRDGMKSNMGRKGKSYYSEDALIVKLAGELADAQCYLDLLAAKCGIDLGIATALKFNEVSEELDVEERLPIA